MPQKHKLEPKSAALTGAAVSEPKKMLDQFSEALRTKHYSFRTEQTYVDGSSATYFFTTNATQKKWAKMRSDKCTNAAKEWAWPYIFPAPQRSTDPHTFPSPSGREAGVRSAAITLMKPYYKKQFDRPPSSQK